MTFIHERAEAALDAITSDTTDAEIAAALADKLLTGARPPHSLSLNHNGKVSPCPVRIDKVSAKRCHVTIAKTADARVWIIDALMRRYEVQAGTLRGQEIVSIAQVRSNIEYKKHMEEWRAKRAAGGPDYDDEVPF